MCKWESNRQKEKNDANAEKQHEVREKIKNVPSPLSTVLKERAIPIHLTLPSSTDTHSPSPSDIRDVFCDFGIPSILHIREGRGSLLLSPREFAEAGGEAVEVLGGVVFRHLSDQHASNGNHRSGVRADYDGFGGLGILVQAGNEMGETVGYTVVELGDRFAL
jgi:hypothetical protein